MLLAVALIVKCNYQSVTNGQTDRQSVKMIPLSPSSRHHG